MYVNAPFQKQQVSWFEIKYSFEPVLQFKPAGSTYIKKNLLFGPNVYAEGLRWAVWSTNERASQWCFCGSWRGQPHMHRQSAASFVYTAALLLHSSGYGCTVPGDSHEVPVEVCYGGHPDRNYTLESSGYRDVNFS